MRVQPLSGRAIAPCWNSTDMQDFSELISELEIIYNCNNREEDYLNQCRISSWNSNDLTDIPS